MITKKYSSAKRMLAGFLLILLTLMLTVPAAASMLNTSDSNQQPDSILDLLPYSYSLGTNVNSTTFSNVTYVNTSFSTPYDVDTSWSFPYTDEFFSQPDNYYCHLFAQCSLGFAVSTFRSKQLNQLNYDNLEAYFTKIGFGNIEAEPFKHTPTTDSVTYAIASKQINNQTVIAVSCCGAGYGAEWSGNLTVGDGDRHEGFDTAATTVKNAINEYIEKYNITGKVSLWTTGYSRAAAIANIVAADMTDSKNFASVYCYTFATPRTCKNPGTYNNIFNIVGKSDPVATIPFADWGYSRYGVTLYTPTEETDSDFVTKKKLVSSIMEEIDGHPYIYNPEVNSQFRTFFDYLTTLLPDASTYANELQPSVLNVMANNKGDNILNLAYNIINTFSADTPEESQELSNLLDYVQELVNQYVLKGNSAQIESGMWSANLNVTQNLTTEHNPDKYIAWMFLSSDPEYIFGQNTSFTNFTVKGNVTLDIFSEKGYVETISPNGKIYKRETTDDVAFVDDTPHELYIETSSGQVNITIPGDMGYVIALTSASNQQITYFGSVHTGDSVHFNLNKVYTLNMQEGTSYPLYFSPNATSWEDTLNEEAGTTDVFSDSHFYSPSTILKMQKINVLHLTVKQVIIFVIAFVLFAYTEFIVFVTLALVRLFQRRPRRAPSTIAVHLVNAAIFFALEFALWYFVPAYPIAYLGARYICQLFILLLAVGATIEYVCKRNVFITLGILTILILSFVGEQYLLSKANTRVFIIKLIIYAILSVAAAIAWLGHAQRRAKKIKAIEQARHERLMIKAQKDVEKAYARAEKATKRYMAKQERAAERAEKRRLKKESQCAADQQ